MNGKIRAIASNWHSNKCRNWWSKLFASAVRWFVCWHNFRWCSSQQMCTWRATQHICDSHVHIPRQNNWRLSVFFFCFLFQNIIFKSNIRARKTYERAMLRHFNIKSLFMQMCICNGFIFGIDQSLHLLFPYVQKIAVGYSEWFVFSSSSSLWWFYWWFFLSSEIFSRVKELSLTN